MGLDEVFQIYSHEEFNKLPHTSIPYGEKFIVVQAPSEHPVDRPPGFTLENMRLLGNLDALRDCIGVLISGYISILLLNFPKSRTASIAIWSTSLSHTANCMWRQ